LFSLNGLTLDLAQGFCPQSRLAMQLRREREEEWLCVPLMKSVARRITDRQILHLIGKKR
jgi:hypothetical protein